MTRSVISNARELCSEDCVLEWMIHMCVFASLQRLNYPHRVASLMRFREKRKERNFDKKIRYSVRKEVALRLVISEVPLSLFCWTSLNLIVMCWKKGFVL